MTEDPKRIVESGYDAIAERFAAWQREVRGSTRLARVERLLAMLPGRPYVLELGCGAGVASTRVLAERGRLTGVDISAEQLRRARERIPEAEFMRADMAEVGFEGGSFDAVVSFYALNHLPREELGPLLSRVAGWLRPGGLFLATFGAADSPAWRGEWLGAEMFFSGFAPDENERLVRAAGLELVESEVETIVEPEGEAQFHWVVARRPE